MMMLALFVVVVLKDRFCSNLFSTTGYESYRFEGPIYIMCLVVPKISRVLSNSLERGKKDRQLLIQHTFRRSLITVLFFWHDAHLAPFSRFTKGLCLNCLVKTVGGSMHLSERKSLLVGRQFHYKDLLTTALISEASRRCELQSRIKFLLSPGITRNGHFYPGFPTLPFRCKQLLTGFVFFLLLQLTEHIHILC